MFAKTSVGVSFIYFFEFSFSFWRVSGSLSGRCVRVESAFGMFGGSWLASRGPVWAFLARSVVAGD